MKRNHVNFLLDVAALLVMLALLQTGFIMKYLLPPGSGHGPDGGPGMTILGWNRHGWGSLHWWLAVGLATLAIVHVALHWRLNREVDTEAIDLLKESSKGDWPGPLMAYASGAADYEEAGMSAGSDPGKLVSILFLRACQLLGEGDQDSASKRLKEVLETGLVADPHYAMALQTLRALNALP